MAEDVDLLIHDSQATWARVAGDYLGIPRIVSHPMFPIVAARRIPDEDEEEMDPDAEDDPEVQSALRCPLALDRRHMGGGAGEAGQRDPHRRRERHDRGVHHRGDRRRVQPCRRLALHRAPHGGGASARAARRPAARLRLPRNLVQHPPRGLQGGRRRVGGRAGRRADLHRQGQVLGGRGSRARFPTTSSSATSSRLGRCSRVHDCTSLTEGATRCTSRCSPGCRCCSFPRRSTSSRSQAHRAARCRPGRRRDGGGGSDRRAVAGRGRGRYTPVPATSAERLAAYDGESRLAAVVARVLDESTACSAA